jgi:hypothetical protein
MRTKKVAAQNAIHAVKEASGIRQQAVGITWKLVSFFVAFTIMRHVASGAG